MISDILPWRVIRDRFEVNTKVSLSFISNMNNLFSRGEIEQRLKAVLPVAKNMACYVYKEYINKHPKDSECGFEYGTDELKNRFGLDSDSGLYIKIIDVAEYKDGKKSCGYAGAMTCYAGLYYQERSVIFIPCYEALHTHIKNKRKKSYLKSYLFMLFFHELVHFVYFVKCMNHVQLEKLMDDKKPNFKTAIEFFFKNAYYYKLGTDDKMQSYCDEFFDSISALTEFFAYLSDMSDGLKGGLQNIWEIRYEDITEEINNADYNDKCNLLFKILSIEAREYRNPYYDGTRFMDDAMCEKFDVNSITSEEFDSMKSRVIDYMSLLSEIRENIRKDHGDWFSLAGSLGTCLK